MKLGAKDGGQLLRTITSMIGATIALTGISPVASSRMAVQFAYDRQCKYIVNRDFDALARSMSYDFVNVDKDGLRTTRIDLITKAREVPIHYTKCNTVVHSVTNLNKSLVAVIWQRIDGILIRGNRRSLIHAISTDRDTWVLQNGRLIETSSRVLKSAVFQDGARIAFQKL